MTIIRTASRVALVGIAALSFAACSSSSSDKSDSKKLDNEVRAAATKAEKAAQKAADEQAAEEAAANATSTTTAPTPPCPSAAEAASILGDGSRVVAAPTCEGNYAAGSASSEVDFAYFLTWGGSSWSRASDAVTNEICGSNPQGLSPQMVSAGCDD